MWRVWRCKAAPSQGPRVWVDQGRLVATEAVRAGAFMAQVGGAGEDGANLPPLYTVAAL